MRMMDLAEMNSYRVADGGIECLADALAPSCSPLLQGSPRAVTRCRSFACDDSDPLNVLLRRLGLFIGEYTTGPSI